MLKTIRVFCFQVLPHLSSPQYDVILCCNSNQQMRDLQPGAFNSKAFDRTGHYGVRVPVAR